MLKNARIAKNDWLLAKWNADTLKKVISSLAFFPTQTE